MHAGRVLLSVVLGFSAVACARAAQSVLIPSSPQTGSSISEVKVTPDRPSASSEVSVTVCGWKPASNYEVYDTDLRIEGAQIWLDLYWHSSGIGLQVVMQYEQTESLGVLDPGVYMLHVTNRGSMSGSAATTFAVCSTPDDPDPSASDPDPTHGLDLSKWLSDHDISTPDLPGFEIKHVAWSDVGSIKEGISELRVKPASPKPSDEVSVTISGWKPSSDLVVERTTLRTEGNEIWLDVYWHTQPPFPVAHAPVGDIQACSFGLAAAPPVTIVQYDITSYWGVPFEYTESLGTLSPGTYVLHVTNHSPMSGSASTTFTVSSAGL